jgi:hypothetical protein
MEFSEKQIEDLIYNSVKDGKLKQLSDRGLYGISKYKFFSRQVTLGDYGRLDLVGLNYRHTSGFNYSENKTLEVGLFEIKKGIIDVNAFLQAIRYCNAIRHYCADYINVEFKIFLIGTGICTGDFCYIDSIIDNLEVYSIKLDLVNGINFIRETGYKLTEPKFKKHDDLELSISKMIKDNIREHVFGKKQQVIEDDELPF